MLQAKEQVRRVTDAMTIENQKQLNELREKMLLEQAEIQVRFDREIKDSRQKHENSYNELQSKHEQQVAQNNQLLDVRRDLETQIKELT